jgi:hypothetical protein
LQKGSFNEQRYPDLHQPDKEPKDGADDLYEPEFFGEEFV